MLKKPFERIPAAHTAETEITVTFDMLDPMKVVYHGNYVHFLEAARCELLDRIGYSYPDMERSGYAWPVVDMTLRYSQPALFGDRLIARAGIVSAEEKLVIAYEIRRKSDNVLLTRAETVQMAVDLKTLATQWEVPLILREKLQAALSNQQN